MKGALVRFILFTGRRLDVFNGNNPDEVVVARNYMRREEAQLMVQESRGGRRGWGPGTERPSFSNVGEMALDHDRGSRMVWVVHKCVYLVLELMKSSQLMAFSYCNTNKLVYHKDDLHQLKMIPFLRRVVFGQIQIHKLKG